MRRRGGVLPRRSAEELKRMRAAGRVVAEMHAAIRERATPGVTTLELNDVAGEVLHRRQASSNFLGYHGFPAVVCASVNDELIHGIPNDRVLLDGDLLSIDCVHLPHRTWLT
jgi:methionyl aminopeptidase